MAAFFVTGSGTDIGKTWLSARLLAAWRARGLSPDALKPVVTGFDPAAPEGSDPAVLLQALGRPVTPAGIEAIAPFRFRAPLSLDQAAAREGQRLSVEAIARACRAAMAAARGPMLIEGAGGVMSPLNGQETPLDVIGALETPCLFVAGSYLGALSHALTGLAALQARGLEVRAVVVNETAGSTVDLHDTVRSLASHCAAPVLTVARGASEAAIARIGEALGV